MTRHLPQIRRRWLGGVALLCVAVTVASAAENAPPGWKLIWQDKFDRTQLDPAKWSHCPRGSADWDAHMSDDPRLFEFKHGALRLRGIVNDQTTGSDSSAFLTGGITTEGKFSFLYGRVEVRARIKNAQGGWPAIWLLAPGIDWPNGGEIDLMEHLNFDSIAYQTVHSPHTEQVSKTEPQLSSSTAAIRKDEFNTYAVDWDADRIVFSVNGRTTFSFTRQQNDGPAEWPFTHPLAIILSMQVGGGWVGAANPAQYPAYLEIESVKVYQRK